MAETIMSKLHDSQMPSGWHQIKSVLIDEIATAANFHLCDRAATALFHARLLGEGIAREVARDPHNEDAAYPEDDAPYCADRLGDTP